MRTVLRRSLPVRNGRSLRCPDRCQPNGENGEAKVKRSRLARSISARLALLDQEGEATGKPESADEKWEAGESRLYKGTTGSGRRSRRVERIDSAQNGPIERETKG